MWLKGVPLGTVAVNVAASVLYAMLTVLNERVPGHEWVFSALKVGALGCLSTISTFMAEMDGMMKDKSTPHFPAAYILLSVCTSVGLSCAVMAAK